MLKNIVCRAAALLVLALGVSAANAQDLGSAAAAATSAVPGFVFKGELALESKPVYDLKIFGADNLIHRVRVDAATSRVLRDRVITLSYTPVQNAAVDIASADAIAEDAINSMGDDAMFFEGECRVHSNGRFPFWKLELASTTTDGLVYEVKVDATSGKVLSISKHV
jgi:uncharacterized membrane protein YkoI